MSEGINTDTVKARLTQALDAIECVVIDTSGGCGAAFEVSVVSAAFEGKSLLQRHRLVNDALRAEMPKIHALSVKRAVTPSQATAQASQADQCVAAAQ
ncbi:bola protein [Haematococcus lacustris]